MRSAISVSRLATRRHGREYHLRHASRARSGKRRSRRKAIQMNSVRYWLALTSAVAVVMLAAGVGTGAMAQDEGEGTPNIETTRSARVQTEPTPAPEATESTDGGSEGESLNQQADGPSPNAADIDINGYDQTIAQGLAAFDAFTGGIWRITELEPLSASEAPSVVAPYYGFLYQMKGTSIVRNDVTGKRARLEPGEAYYFSTGDSYTRYREVDVSRAWLIEIVPADAADADAAGVVIFTTSEIGSFPDDTRDLELLAAHLLEDGTATVPDYEADAMIMATVGSLQVTGANGPKVLDAPAALLVSGELEIENLSGAPATYLIAKIGPSVEDAAPAVEEEPVAGEAVDGTAEAEVDPLLDTDGDLLIDTDEVVYGTDPAIADTDFDGYPDGDEVLVYETDPLDANSYP